MEGMLEKVAQIETRYEELEGLMAQPEVASNHEQFQVLAKERSSLQDLVLLYRDYRHTAAQIDDARSLLNDRADPEMASLASEEVQTLEGSLSRLWDQLQVALLPSDPNDERDVIVEIRAGAGGREAAIFASDLFRMYTRYGALQKWAVEVLDTSESDLGGLKEIVFEVRGVRAFSHLKFERGVHRVQRVPVTEAMGRIHTSTATVAVLPQVDEVEANISPNDLRIDIYHAGGHGGQNVNKVATAVRIVHVPTGTVSVCQDERSQFKNKQKAMAILRARLYEAEQRKQEGEIAEDRRAQVGTGDRSEKIRTYNFPQDRLTDHRIGQTFHGLERVLDGNLDQIIDPLLQWERDQLLGSSLN